MKTLLAVLCGLAVTAASVRADDLTREVQQHLKDQGFFYGEVDGQGGGETSAAIRRYQIRFGLKVTGELNDETMRSLGISGEPQHSSSPSYQANQPNRAPADGYTGSNQPRNPGYNRAPDRDPDESDNSDEDQAIQPAPRFSGAGGTNYRLLFFGTVYDGAPGTVQRNVLYTIQGELARSGFYRGELDGQPGPATLDAIARFQQEEGLNATGRLDNETLGALQALPGQRHGPPQTSGYTPGPPPNRVYRGIWIH